MIVGQAISALHAMAILQVHQAKVLRDMHEGRADPGLMQELRTATGQVMSTCVVQERHLWLNLVDMWEAERTRFLSSLISQAGLFGGAVEDFAQQFLAAQKQTEAFSGAGSRTTSSPGRVRIFFSPSPAAGLMLGSTLKPLKKELTPLPPSPKRPWMAVFDAMPHHSRSPLSPDPCQSRPPWNARPSLASSVRTRNLTMPPHRDATPPMSGPVLPHRCPFVGTPVVPMTPLVQFLGAWLELPNLTRWLGYEIQFGRSPPRF
ncbi:hypothetical protein PO909_023611 [Leuciscus waleckii]